MRHVRYCPAIFWLLFPLVICGQGALTNGQNHTGSIASGQTQSWTFSANANDSISISIGETSDPNGLFLPWIRLQGPNGAAVGSAGYGYTSGHINTTAPSNGTYTVLVASNDNQHVGTESYRLTLAKTPGSFVVPSGDEGGPMTNGANHTGTIHLADLDQWTFQATAGDSISVNIGEVTDTSNGYFLPWIRLRGPNGAAVGSAGYGYVSGHINATAPSTGTYTVLVASADNNGDGTGTYRLTLAKTPGSFVVPSGDDGGPMTNGANHTGTIHLGDLDQWTFQATAGDAISLGIGELTETSSGYFLPWIRLRGPNGAAVGSAGYGYVSGHINATAPTTGTYTVLVASADNNGDGTGTYRLTLAKTPGSFVVPSGDDGGPMTNGANHTGTIHLADIDQWTFQATAGDAISLSIGELTDTSNGYFLPWIRLRGPNGAAVGSAGYGYVSGHINATAPTTGTYTVLVASGDNNGDGTGTYRLTLAKTPGTFVVPSGDDGGPMTNGANHTGTIHLADIDQWTFQATAGDAISLSIGELTDTSSGYFLPWIRLRGPNGAAVGSAGYGYVSGHINATAPTTGTYTVLVASGDNNGDGTGTYTLTLVKTPGTYTTSSGDQGGRLSRGPNTVGAIHLGDLDPWTFDAVAGETITISIDETSDANGYFIPWIRLRRPTGAQIASDYNYQNARINVVAPVSGTYTLVVGSGDNNGDGVGTYRLTSSHGIAPPITELSVTGKNLGCSGGVGSVKVGDPCDVATGNHFEHVTDYETATANKLRFARSYNSAIGGSTGIPAMLGRHWRGTYDRYLRVNSASSVSVERPDGRILEFTLTAGAWKTDTDVDFKLTQSGATWTLVDLDDNVETYTGVSAAQANVTSLRSRNGYTLTLSYSGAELRSVTDSFGRSLQFTYQNGLLRTLTTPDNLTVTYGYDASAGTPDRLISVAYSTTPQTGLAYLYENSAFPFALTGITDENGQRFASWTYDAQGRVTSSEHAGGVERTTIAYNADGTRTVTHPLGVQEVYTFTMLQGVPKVTRIARNATATTAAAARTFTYDTNGYLASMTDWNGNRTTFTNDARGLATTIIEAAGTPQARTTTNTYDAVLHVPVKIVQPGITTDLSYDASGNLLTRTLTDTTTTSVPYSTNGVRRVWTYTWGPNGLLSSVRGPRTDVTQSTGYTYDGSSALVRITNAQGQQTQITQHTPGGLPQTIVDPNNVTTQIAYDARLRVTSVAVATSAGARTTAYTYDAAGNLLTTTLPDGSKLTNTYDAAHRLVAVTDLLNQVTAYTLDALGNRTRTEVKDASGNVRRTSSATFDALGRKLQDLGAAGQTTKYAYDGNGNVLTITDALNRITRQTFDALNRVTRRTDPAGGATATTYDGRDRPLSVTAPNNGITSYVYSGFGDLIQEQSPDTGKTVLRYDLAGNLVQRVDARNVVEEHTYDALDRRLNTIYPAAVSENVARRYDEAGHGFGAGRLTSLTDESGTLSFTYDERGNILSAMRTSGAATLLTAYTYDSSGRVASITYPSGGAARYAFDSMGRVTSLAWRPRNSPSDLPVLASIAYEPFGPVKSLTYGNGVAATRGFDRDYRLTNLTDSGVQNLTYTYNAADQVLGIADGVTSGAGQTFTYDTLDRLTSATGIYGRQTYSYDTLGNRTSQVFGSTTTSFTYTPQSNRLIRAQAGSTTQTFSYTPSGSIASIVNTPSTIPTTTLSYSQAGRLRGVMTGSTQTAGYSFDAFGRRAAKVVAASVAALYQYDPAGRLLEETDGQGAALRDYLYLEDAPVALFAPATSSLTFIHTDRLGTPQKVTDGSRAVVWRANYEPFGDVHAASSQTAAVAQNLRLPGQEFEAETSFHSNWYRDYVPALGRYLESDPVGLAGGMNTYSYAAMNPVNRTDRLGLEHDRDLVPYGTAADQVECFDDPRRSKAECEAIGRSVDARMQRLQNLTQFFGSPEYGGGGALSIVGAVGDFVGAIPSEAFEFCVGTLNQEFWQAFWNRLSKRNGNTKATAPASGPPRSTPPPPSAAPRPSLPRCGEDMRGPCLSVTPRQ